MTLRFASNLDHLFVCLLAFVCSDAVLEVVRAYFLKPGHKPGFINLARPRPSLLKQITEHGQALPR